MKPHKGIISHKRQCLISATISLFLLVGSYLIENCPYPLFDDIDLISWYEQLSPNKNDDFNWNDVMCINVGLDKTLTPITDDFGDTAGFATITNRDSLLKCLTILSTAQYREIFIDVRFPKNLDDGLGNEAYTIQTNHKTDSALFELMAKMPRIVISNHSDQELADSIILPKCAYSDYGATIFTGFARYEYVQHGDASVALRIYQDLDGKTIQRKGLLAFDGGRLCRNAQFLHIPQCLAHAEHQNGDAIEPNYPLLSANLLKWHTDNELRNMAKGKVVLIGDFETDIHTTYAGDIPGSMLSYLAYTELHNGKHLISWFDAVRFLFYMAVIYLLLYTHKSWYEYLSWNRLERWHLLRFLMSFIGISLAMAAFKLFVAWQIFGLSISTFVPALAFSIINEMKRYTSEYTQIK